MTLLGALARLAPWSVDPSDDLRRAIAFIGWETAPETVVRAGIGAGLIVGGAAVAGLLVGAIGGPVAVATLAIALGTVHVVHAAPLVLAKARRTSALGDAPDLVARAVLRMRVSPSPERAAAFAARAEGPLADSLGAHVARAVGTPGSGLTAFGETWAEWFPQLQRSLGLVAAAGRAGEDARDRTLDRALTVVMEGTADQMRDFATEIRGPAAGIYAFGVLVPMALVALLPAAHAAGISVTPLTVGFVYDGLLPVVLVTASVWLVASRPVAFRPPAVGPAHPDVPDRRATAVAAGFVAAALGWILAPRWFPAWAPPIAAAGLGPGVALTVRYRPVVTVHDRVEAVEAGLSDALALVGRRVADGRSVEVAIAQSGEELDGPMGEALAAGAARQRNLSVDVETAFLGERGALARIPSPRVHRSVAFLGLAAREGPPAGAALLSLADHVDELRSIERDARQALERVCGTLRSTAAVFGPLVGGATVALADTMAGGQGLVSTAGARAPAMAWLGLAVGGYVLAMSVILTTLAVGLRRGFDRSLAAHSVGRALVLATVTFLVAYRLTAGLA